MTENQRRKCTNIEGLNDGRHHRKLRRHEKKQKQNVPFSLIWNMTQQSIFHVFDEKHVLANRRQVYPRETVPKQNQRKCKKNNFLASALDSSRFEATENCLRTGSTEE
jgi:hypothetical protein